MSKMSELHHDRQVIDAVLEAMKEPVLSAEEQVERKCDWIIRELDELCALANNAETIDLVETESLSIGQMNTRVQLVLSFLAARKVPKLKMVQNNG